MKQIIYSSLKLLLIVSIINALQSCRNTCEPSCCGGDEETGLYFTALSESDGVPLVFETSKDLSEVSILRENARIFSAPAENGDFCYSRENVETGKTEIYLANLSNQSDINITDNLAKKDDLEYTYPVMSPTGGAITLNLQNNWLFLFSYKNGAERHSIISTSLLPKSAPSFSPNGNYLAFFSGQFPNISLNVFDIANELGPNKIFQLNNLIDNRRGQIIADWSGENNSICFAFDELIDKDTVKSIYVVDLSGNLLSKITNNKLGMYQAVFSPDNTNEILFVSNAGDLWIADRSSEETLFRKLTGNFPSEINANPNWATNSQNIVFTKFFEDSKEDSELYMLDVNTKGEMLISNKAFSAYWRR